MIFSRATAIPVYEFNVGMIFPVAIGVGNSDYLTSIGFSLLWDNNIVKAVKKRGNGLDFTEGSLFGVIERELLAVEQEPGKAMVSYALKNNQSVYKRSGDVITLNFQAVGVGTTAISTSNEIPLYVDKNGTAYQYKKSSGSLEVKTSTVPTDPIPDMSVNVLFYVRVVE